MKESISFAEALKIIKLKNKTGKQHPFDISFRTLQRNSKKGGKLTNYKGVVLLANEKQEDQEAKIYDNILLQDRQKRNPEHWKNRTLNIKLEDGQIRKIHVRLIVGINGKNIVY